MVTLQIINKVLSTHNIDIIKDNALDSTHFIGYENEFNFILEHYEKYKTVPDKETFLNNFEEFGLVVVQETDQYLIDTLLEENLYYKSVGVVQGVAELLKTNANDAVEYLHSKMGELVISQTVHGEDIISKADSRYQVYLDKLNSEGDWYIATGLAELDSLIYGWAKGEEFGVIFARTGEGKSWVLSKFLTSAWKEGNTVGYISPEMSPIKLGYRFDTLFKHFSNTKLVRGISDSEYCDYIKKLGTYQTPFIVATPKDFGKKITIAKLRAFVNSNKLDILGIDGVHYLSDERHKKGDTKTISLTNISEDIMELSSELNIPIIVVVQSNRNGVRTDDSAETPDLENIKDSDGIAQNATKVIAIRQVGGALQLDVKKHRDGENGGRVLYYWDIDKGDFNYIPSETDSTSENNKSESIAKVRQEFNDGTEAF
jgi:replicative DNA helicase